MAEKMTRREFHKRVAGTAAAGVAASAGVVSPPPNGEPGLTAPEVILERIQSERSAPISDEQRASALESIRHYLQQSAQLRAAAVPDCAEPDTVFLPTRRRKGPA